MGPTYLVVLSLGEQAAAAILYVGSDEDAARAAYNDAASTLYRYASPCSVFLTTARAEAHR